MQVYGDVYAFMVMQAFPLFLMMSMSWLSSCYLHTPSRATLGPWGTRTSRGWTLPCMAWAAKATLTLNPKLQIDLKRHWAPRAPYRVCGGGWSDGAEVRIVMWSLVSGFCLSFLHLLLGA